MAKTLEEKIAAKAEELKRLRSKAADRRRDVERLLGQVLLIGNPGLIPELVKEMATAEQKQKLDELGFKRIVEEADKAYLKRRGIPQSAAPAPRGPVMPVSDSEPARLQEFVRQNP